MNLIVDIHGALSTRRSFSFLKDRLKNRIAHKGDWGSFSYDIRKESANEIVDRLVIQLTEYANDEYTNMVLLCHSFGGVVGIAAARELISRFPQLEIKVITMGTPLGGSGAASIMRLLKPGSIFLKNIGAYDRFMLAFNSKPLACRTLSIITTAGDAEWVPEPNDSVVTVESQLEYIGDENFYPVKLHVNHFEVLLSEETIKIIDDELKGTTSD